MTALRCELRCRCGASAVFEAPEDRPTSFYQAVGQWQQQHSACPQGPAPVSVAFADTPAVPECAHQWYSDTGGTHCGKCGLSYNVGPFLSVAVLGEGETPA